MAATDYRSLVRLIDQLYAGALDPAAWPKFLESAARMFGAQNAFICQLKDRREPIQYIGLSQKRRDAIPVSRYPSLIDEDPRAPRFSRSHGRPVHCGMGLTRETLKRSRAYREYLKPLGIEHTMVVVFPTGEGRTGRAALARGNEGVTHDLGLMRSDQDNAFSDADCELLSELSPHIERAFAIARALEAREPRRAPVRPAPVVMPAEGILQQRLGLSPTQARTTVMLMAGRNVREIAEALGIAEDSVRQYLKRIYQKTGTRRQVDLVRLAIRTCDTQPPAVLDA